MMGTLHLTSARAYHVPETKKRRTDTGPKSMGRGTSMSWPADEARAMVEKYRGLAETAVPRDRERCNELVDRWLRRVEEIEAAGRATRVSPDTVGG